MASEMVQKVLSAESMADKLNAEARKKADDIVLSAQQTAAVAVQKKLAQAKAEAEKIRQSDNARLAEYAENAGKDCEKQIDGIRREVEKNTDSAVNAVISSFFA